MSNIYKEENETVIYTKDGFKLGDMNVYMNGKLCAGYSKYAKQYSTIKAKKTYLQLIED